ncbi:ester cyclase [Spongisporangium articulatum]|uniref:Ester cyclase n=1 Tax=Spongisporangium articulatum TaxID=3362603 RepID=A0ABW8AQW5_9ACTN
MSPKDVVRSYHEALWRDGDLGAVERFWAPDAKVHMTGFEGTAVDVVHEDVTRYFGAFTNIDTSIEDLLGDGDKVALRWATAGDHVGPYGDVPASGKRITMRGVDVFRVEGERIVECWSMWDGLDVYDQFGLLPEGLA